MTMDLPIDGKLRHVIVHAPKNGFFYILDALTGKFLSGVPFVYQNWARGLDPHTGRPDILPEALWASTGKSWIAKPGSLGAHNWQSMAYSPKTRLVYIPGQQIPKRFEAVDHLQLNSLGQNLGRKMGDDSIPTDDPKSVAAAKAELQGWLLAWDPDKQALAYKIDHKGPWNGGILATGGDLVFQGLADGQFHAYDANNGQDLFAFDAQSGIVAAPISYAVGGKQYVAVEVGWGAAYAMGGGANSRSSGWTVNHSRIVAFALDGRAVLPSVNDQGFLPVKPPDRFNEEAAQLGYQSYQKFCAGCHGDNAVSGGVLPDVRWSGAIRAEDGFFNVVGRGALGAYGMSGFSAVLDAPQIDDIRQYLIRRAHDTYHNEVDSRRVRASVPK